MSYSGPDPALDPGADPGASVPDERMLEVSVSDAAEPRTPMASELRIEAHLTDCPGHPGRGGVGAAVLSDRFYVHVLRGVSIGRTGIEMDPGAGYRRWRPAEFVEWLDAVRPYVQDAIARDRADRSRSDGSDPS